MIGKISERKSVVVVACSVFLSFACNLRLLSLPLTFLPDR